MTNKKVRETVAKIMYDMTKTMFHANLTDEEDLEVWKRVSEIVSMTYDSQRYESPE